MTASKAQRNTHKHVCPPRAVTSSSTVVTHKVLLLLLSFGMAFWIVFTVLQNSTKVWSAVNLYISPPQLNFFSMPLGPTATQTELRIKEFMEQLDRLFPPRPFSHLNATTSANHNRASILNPRDTYCRGEQLHVLLEARDHLGRRKEYGGDFLRARLFSPGLKAGAAGKVTDLQNGSYLVSFSLLWEGPVTLSVLLLHPSEGASALWRARNQGYDKVRFHGLFVNGSSKVLTECGLRLSSSAELCEYLDTRDQEAFYCVKPPGYPCEAFTNMFTNHHVSYLTVQEQSLFSRANVGVEMMKGLKYVAVSQCNKTEETRKEKCHTGMQVPVPGGFTLQGTWTPTFCSQTQFDSVTARDCLKGKVIYLLGDSTLRQWIDHFPKVVRTLKHLGVHGKGVFQQHLLVDTENNIQIHWKRHSYPFVTLRFYSVIDVAYIPREIDRIPGDKNTVVAITLGLHFRPFPVQVFIRRALSVRKAVERLFLRSPDTKVILKTENTREMYPDIERFSNFHGHVNTLILKQVFQGLNVGLIDAWDMTIAYDSNDLHPPSTVIASQVNLFLNYIC